MYKDYEKEVVPDGTYIPYFVKRRFFSDEREVRAVIVDPPANAQGQEDLTQLNNTLGRAVPADLSAMLDAIVCRPNAPPEEHKMVEEISRAAGLPTPVLHSQLSDEPRFN